MSQKLPKYNEVLSPNDMRVAIFKMAYEDPLVRSCMDAANYGGLSAEDRYTMIAYYALKSREEMSKYLLEAAHFPRFIVEAGQIKNLDVDGLPKWVGPKKEGG